jgi:hypothetical protein
VGGQGKAKGREEGTHDLIKGETKCYVGVGAHIHNGMRELRGSVRKT